MAGATKPLRPLSSAQNYTANTIHSMPDKYHGYLDSDTIDFAI